jgi:hypothetical protein
MSTFSSDEVVTSECSHDTKPPHVTHVNAEPFSLNPDVCSRGGETAQDEQQCRKEKLNGNTPVGDNEDIHIQNYTQIIKWLLARVEDTSIRGQTSVHHKAGQKNDLCTKSSPEHRQFAGCFLI